jgi:hypothetical protein
MDLALPQGQAQLRAPGQLLVLGGLRGVGEGIEGGPVGVGQGPLGVVGLELVVQEVVHGHGHEHFRGVALRDGEEPPAVVRAARVAGVVGLHAVGLPLAAEDDGEGPLRDVGAVGARGVARRRGDVRAAVDQVHHPAHLQSPSGPPALLAEIVIGRQLGPDPVDEPDGPGGLRVVLSQGLVEARRVDGVDADGVHAQVGHLRDPAGVGGLVRELAGVTPRQGGAQVHALDEEGAPAAAAIGNLEAPALDAGGKLQGCRPHQGRQGRGWIGGQLPGPGHGLLNV